MSTREQPTVEPWPVHCEDLRGGRYWCVTVPGMSETIDVHEDDGGEVLARRIASLPVMEAICRSYWGWEFGPPGDNDVPNAALLAKWKEAANAR